jgi:hypothetical protein
MAPVFFYEVTHQIIKHLHNMRSRYKLLIASKSLQNKLY